MNVSKISLTNPNLSMPIQFKGEKKEHHYENPVSRSTERNLAILSSVGVSGILGAIAWGLTTSFAFKNKNIPAIAGATVAALTLLFSLPANLYHTRVNAFVKQKDRLVICLFQRKL